MYAAQLYGRVAHSVSLIAAQYWGLPLHMISMLLSTLQLMTFSLGRGFGDSGISYGSTRNNPSQGLFQGNGGGLVIILCVRTYIIKLL